MNYLFFDIECASSKDNNCKICSLGYMIADENLKIIKSQEDIVINPAIANKDWDWRVVKTMLAYPKSFIEKQPTFPKFYKKLKKLFEDEDTLVCGFSVKDDIGYLTDEFVRYDLEPFNYQFFDIQGLHREYRKEEIKGGLAVAYVYWCNRLPNKSHRSDDDVYSTYAVAKAICKIQNKSLAQLVEENPKYLGRVDGLKFGFNNEEFLTKEEIRIRSTEKKADREAMYANHNGKKEGEFRELKPEYSDYLLKGSKNSVLFLRLLDNCKQESERERIFEGKKISISLNYEMYNFKNMMKLVQIICDCGGEYVKKGSLADIFVKYSHQVNGEDRKCTKLSYVQEAIGNGANIQIVEFEEFLSILGLDEEKLNLMPEKDYDYLLDEKYKKVK